MKIQALKKINTAALTLKEGETAEVQKRQAEELVKLKLAKIVKG